MHADSWARNDGRERKNRGLAGGGRGTRTAGVARDLSAEKGRECWRYFASKSASIFQRMSSLSVRYESFVNLEFRCHEIPSDELNSSKGSGPRARFGFSLAADPANSM